MNTDTLVLLLMSSYFWLITLIKNVNNFEIAKVKPQDVAQYLLDFLPITYNILQIGINLFQGDISHNVQWNLVSRNNFPQEAGKFSHRRCSVKQGVLKPYLKNDSNHTCYPVNFAKFLRTPLGDCFCNSLNYSNIAKCRKSCFFCKIYKKSVLILHK